MWGPLKLIFEYEGDELASYFFLHVIVCIHARGRFDYNILSANRHYLDALVTTKRRCDETKQRTFNTLLSKEASVMQAKVPEMRYWRCQEELSSRHLNKLKHLEFVWKEDMREVTYGEATFKLMEEARLDYKCLRDDNL